VPCACGACRLSSYLSCRRKPRDSACSRKAFFKKRGGQADARLRPLPRLADALGSMPWTSFLLSSGAISGAVCGGFATTCFAGALSTTCSSTRRFRGAIPL
jgi:hypothetical protein